MDDALYLEQLHQLLAHVIQRVTALEVQLHALQQRLGLEEEERQKLPFFQRKRAVSGDNPPASP